MNSALLILRLVLGVAMAAHGSQKLFGWFGGPGLEGFGSFLETIGFRPGIRFALVAGMLEFLSGLLVALGLAGPVGPALMMSVMVVAAVTVHLGHGFFVSTNGVELPTLYLAGAVALAFTGSGQFSLDHVLGMEPVFPQMVSLVALVVGILGALGNLALRDVPKQVIKPS
jgi:putative oxidoreductase